MILSPGTGPELKYSDAVYMNFEINSFDGKAKYNDPQLYRYSSYLGYLEPKTSKLPEAFRIALKDILKKRGGSIRLIIPSRLAYGRTGITIPFTIEGNQSLDCTIRSYDIDNIIDFEDVFVKKYIQEKNITGLTKTPTGLYYQIITPGAGVDIGQLSTVTTIYTGKLTNGTIFEQNDSTKPLVGTVESFVAGWREGLPLIKKGGKIRLILSPLLAYGSNVTAKIPSNSILDFEVEVTEVTN